MFWRLYFCMVKYLSFHISSFALRYFLVYMASPQCDTPLVSFRGVGILLFPICSQPMPQHVPNSSSVYPIFFCHKFYSYDLYKQPLVVVCFWTVQSLIIIFLWWTNELCPSHPKKKSTLRICTTNQYEICKALLLHFIFFVYFGPLMG
jgi:hypothetical protein